MLQKACIGSQALLLCIDAGLLQCYAKSTLGFCTSHSCAALQHKCATTKPRTLLMPTAPVLLCEASWKQPCYTVQLHLWVFALHTAVLHFSISVQQPSLGPSSCPLHQCFCVRQAGKSLASICVQQSSLGPSSCPLHQCFCVRQAGNSLATQCNCTYGFLHFTQLRCTSAYVCSNRALDPAHAHCTSASV